MRTGRVWLRSIAAPALSVATEVMVLTMRKVRLEAIGLGHDAFAEGTFALVAKECLLTVGKGGEVGSTGTSVLLSRHCQSPSLALQ